MLQDYSLLWWGLLVITHLVLQSRFIAAWPDWDTANHLYFAFLRNRGVSFENSYGPGVKWATPRLYTLLWPLLEGNHGRFRFVNMIGGLIFLAILVAISGEVTPHTLALWTFAVLLINSGYVNPQTSASEFLSTPLALATIFFVPEILPFPLSLYVQTLLIVFIAWAFKAVELSWLLPIGIQHWSPFLEAPYIVVPAITIAVVFAYAIAKHQIGSVNTYSKTRSFLHPKNVSFLRFSPFFVLANLALTAANTWWGSPFEWALLAAVWIAFFSQRSFVFYFWHPILLTNLLLAAQLTWIATMPLDVLWGAVCAIFLFITLPLFISTGSKYGDGHIRRYYYGAKYRKSQMEMEEREVEWLKDNIPNEQPVYLWGSQVNLLLEAKLVHLSDTFYNHNHLFYWSNIQDKAAYAVDVIRERKPDFVIEAAIIENEQFPAQEFADSYTLYKEFEAMKVYRRVAE